MFKNLPVVIGCEILPIEWYCWTLRDLINYYNISRMIMEIILSSKQQNKMHLQKLKISIIKYFHLGIDEMQFNTLMVIIYEAT